MMFCLFPYSRQTLLFDWIIINGFHRFYDSKIRYPPVLTWVVLRAFMLWSHSLPGFHRNVEVTDWQTLSECAGSCREMELCVDLREANSIEMHLMETDGEFFRLTVDRQTGLLTVDRSRCGYSLAKTGDQEEKPWASMPVRLTDGQLKLRIFVDVSIVEVYVNDGEAVLTSQAFPIGKDYGVSVSADGRARITSLTSYEMCSPD